MSFVGTSIFETKDYNSLYQLSNIDFSVMVMFFLLSGIVHSLWAVSVFCSSVVLV